MKWRTLFVEVVLRRGGNEGTFYKSDHINFIIFIDEIGALCARRKSSDPGDALQKIQWVSCLCLIVNAPTLYARCSFVA